MCVRIGEYDTCTSIGMGLIGMGPGQPMAQNTCDESIVRTFFKILNTNSLVLVTATHPLEEVRDTFLSDILLRHPASVYHNK